MDTGVLAEYVPELRAGRGGWIGLLALFGLAAASAVLILIDTLWPAWSGAGQVAAILLAFPWVGQFFWRRKAYLARWGDMAYRNAFARHMLPGMPLIFAAIAHNAYLPGVRVATGWTQAALFAAGLYFFSIGLVLWARAASIFGLDNLSMLYVYYPEKSRLVKSSIYALIRHPVYAGVVRVGLALGLWRGTWFSIAFGLFMPIGLTLWLRLAEERELLERFGERYADYRRSVPAFWPRFQNAGKFANFLLFGEGDERSPNEVY
jgi:protein-S-isoprenylcysteine O-methyltransferase Ste14